MPRQTLTLKEWLATHQWPLYPNFRGRAKRFYLALRKRLRGGLPVRVRIDGWPPEAAYRLWNGFRRGNFGRELGPSMSLFVYTPPTWTRRGRRLLVLARLHDRFSREALGIDGDYGVENCHVIALEEGDPYTKRMEWKCVDDALVGIHEWLNGTLYIPGP